MQNSNFRSGLKWSSLEQGVVQTLILTHQLLLKQIFNLSDFGFCNALFSLVWLLSTWLNFGFDSSLSPLFHRSVQDKRLFWRIILRPLLLQSMFVLTIPIVAIPAAIYFLGLQTTFPVMALLALAAVAEASKRILRSLLHFASKFKPLAILEIATNLAYVIIVWGYYWSYRSLSMTTLLLPFVLVTFMEITGLLFLFWRWHQQLPTTTQEHTPPPTMFIVSARATGYMHQLASQLLSSNVLVPLTAAYFGLSQAGALSLASNISYYITSFIKRTFGITTGSVLAFAKPQNQETKRALISTATSGLYLLLSIVGCVCVLLFPAILKYFAVATPSANSLSPEVDLLPIYLFLFVAISEQFLLPFEKILLTEEHPLLLTFFHCSYIALLFGALSYAPSRMLLIIATIGIRLATAGALIFLCYRKLNIYPKLPIHTAASLITFLVIAISQLVNAA